MDFDYGLYLSGCFQRYSLKIISISDSSWALAVALCLLNYLRLKLGPQWMWNCRGFKSADDPDADSAGRYGLSRRCSLLHLQLFFCCGCALCVYILVVYLVSRLYVTRCVLLVCLCLYCVCILSTLIKSLQTSAPGRRGGGRGVSGLPPTRAGCVLHTAGAEGGTMCGLRLLIVLTGLGRGVFCRRRVIDMWRSR